MRGDAQSCISANDAKAISEFYKWLQSYVDKIAALVRQCLLRVQADALAHVLRQARAEQHASWRDSTQKRRKVLGRRRRRSVQSESEDTDQLAPATVTATATVIKKAKNSMRDASKHFRRLSNVFTHWRVEDAASRNFVNDWVQVESGTVTQLAEASSEFPIFAAAQNYVYFYERYAAELLSVNMKTLTCSGKAAPIGDHALDDGWGVCGVCFVESFGAVCVLGKRGQDLLKLICNNSVTLLRLTGAEFGPLFRLDDSRVMLLTWQTHRAVQDAVEIQLASVTARVERRIGLDSLQARQFAYNANCGLVLAVSRKAAHIMIVAPRVRLRVTFSVREACYTCAVTSHPIFLLCHQHHTQLFDVHGRPAQRVSHCHHLPGVSELALSHPVLSIHEDAVTRDVTLFCTHFSLLQYARLRSRRHSFSFATAPICDWLAEPRDLTLKAASVNVSQHKVTDRGRLRVSTDKLEPVVMSAVYKNTLNLLYWLDAANNSLKRSEVGKDAHVEQYVPETGVVVNCFAFLDESLLAVLCDNSTLVHVHACSMQPVHAVRLRDCRRHRSSEAFMCVLQPSRLFFAEHNGNALYEATRTSGQTTDWRLAKRHTLQPGPDTRAPHWRVQHLDFDPDCARFSVLRTSATETRLSVLSPELRETHVLRVPDALNGHPVRMAFLWRGFAILKLGISGFALCDLAGGDAAACYACELHDFFLLPLQARDGASFQLLASLDESLFALDVSLADCHLTLATDTDGRLKLEPVQDAPSLAMCPTQWPVYKTADLKTADDLADPWVTSFVESDAALYFLDLHNKKVKRTAVCDRQQAASSACEVTFYCDEHKAKEADLVQIAALDAATLLVLWSDGTLVHVDASSMRSVHAVSLPLGKKFTLATTEWNALDACRLLVPLYLSQVLYEVERSSCTAADWRLKTAHCIPHPWKLQHLHFDRSSGRFLLSLMAFQNVDGYAYRLSLVDRHLCELCVLPTLLLPPERCWLAGDVCTIQDESKRVVLFCTKTRAFQKVTRPFGEALAVQQRLSSLVLISRTEDAICGTVLH